MDHHLVSSIRAPKKLLQVAGLVLLLMMLFATAFPATEARAGDCTYSQGYWKNHADPAKHYDEAWDIAGGPQAAFFNASQGWLQVLDSPSESGNAYYILARQYIAARLNFYAGADAAIVSPSLGFAEGLFSSPLFAGCSGKSCAITNTTNSQYFDLAVQHAEILEQFNTGEIGPGRCEP